MRRWILVLLIAAGMTTMSGCFTFDARHNRHILSMFKTDIRELHADFDFVFAMEDETPLNNSYYR